MSIHLHFHTAHGSFLFLMSNFRRPNWFLNKSPHCLQGMAVVVHVVNHCQCVCVSLSDVVCLCFFSSRFRLWWLLPFSRSSVLSVILLKPFSSLCTRRISLGKQTTHRLSVKSTGITHDAHAGWIHKHVISTAWHVGLDIHEVIMTAWVDLFYCLFSSSLCFAFVFCLLTDKGEFP